MHGYKIACVSAPFADILLPADGLEMLQVIIQISSNQSIDGA